MDPFISALLGIISLILAYVIITSNSTVENDDPHPLDNANTFSTSGASRVEGNALISEYTPPHPPHDNVGAVPSMTRVFNNLVLVEKDRRTPSSRNTLKIDPLQGGSSASTATLKQTHQAYSSDAEPCATGERGETYRAMSAPPDSPPHSVTSFLRAHNSTRAGTPGQHLAPTTPMSASSSAPRSILTRSRSTLFTSSSEPGVAARSMSVPLSQAPVASSPSKCPRVRNVTVSKRHTRKCARNPKFLNVLPNGERPATAYFMSSDRKPVDEPPMEELLKKLPPLQVGDLYCHKTASVTLIWIYHEDKDKTERFWERIDVGYVREVDGRMLSLTASGNPNFVGDEWANKRQSTEEKRRMKGKGKQVDEAGNDDTDELESEDD